MPYYIRSIYIYIYMGQRCFRQMPDELMLMAKLAGYERAGGNRDAVQPPLQRPRIPHTLPERADAAAKLAGQVGESGWRVTQNKNV